MVEGLGSHQPSDMHIQGAGFGQPQVNAQEGSVASKLPSVKQAKQELETKWETVKTDNAEKMANKDNALVNGSGKTDSPMGILRSVIMAPLTLAGNALVSGVADFAKAQEEGTETKMSDIVAHGLSNAGQAKLEKEGLGKVP